MPPASGVAGRPAVREEAMMLETIVVPLDGSALAEQAVPYAAALARAGDGKLVLLHVSSPLFLDDEPPFDPTPTAQRPRRVRGRRRRRRHPLSLHRRPAQPPLQARGPGAGPRRLGRRADPRAAPGAGRLGLRGALRRGGLSSGRHGRHPQRRRRPARRPRHGTGRGPWRRPGRTAEWGGRSRDGHRYRRGADAEETAGRTSSARWRAGSPAGRAAARLRRAVGGRRPPRPA